MDWQTIDENVYVHAEKNIWNIVGINRVSLSVIDTPDVSDRFKTVRLRRDWIVHSNK